MNFLKRKTSGTSSSNEFESIKIGNQIWMSNNLNIDVAGSWGFDTLEKEPNNPYNFGDPDHQKEYGRLYTYDAAIKACPPGWRLPSKKDFEQLVNFLGGENIDTINALRPNGSSGFRAYPAGRYYDGKYIDGGFECYFWNSANEWWVFALNYKYQGEIPRFQNIGKDAESAISVRFIKDE
jgi:uncharacterized protein (TIGR02145 family)